MVKLDNLFFIIEKKGLTAKKVSEDTGISSGNISDWKKGRSMPTANKLDTLANYLECSVDYLIGRTNIPNTFEVNGDISHSTIGAIGGDTNNSILINGDNILDETSKEILRILNSLPLKERTKLLNMIYDFEDNYLKK